MHYCNRYTGLLILSYTTISRPQLNMLKSFPKILLGISQNFYLLCSSSFPLRLYYAPIRTTMRPHQINFMIHRSELDSILQILSKNVNHMITVIWWNIAEEATNSWYEWLNIYNNWGAAVVKNRGITMCS